MALLTTQDNRYLSIQTSLGKDALILNKFQGHESFSDLFRFEAETYVSSLSNTQDANLDFSSLIQQGATVEITIDDKVRYFNGIITQISQGPTVAFGATPGNKTYEKTYYYLTIQPKAWLMTLFENCCIFQNQTTIAIIKSVLTFHQIDVVDRTSKAGTSVREYCVQYNESDFNFISRLMEAEGIFYYFSHTSSGHSMILCDNTQPFEENANYPQVPVLYYTDQLSSELPGLVNLRISEQIVSSGYTTKDYDFTKPSTNLKADSTGQGNNYVIYNYPGNYVLQSYGQNITDRRLAAAEFPSQSVTGDTNILLEIGTSFSLTNSPRTDANKDYVTYHLHHEAVQEPEETPNTNNKSSLYKNHVVIFDKNQLYLPPLKTRQPKIYGTQTALVTGKDGEEIWTDQYGRILVKFFWDLSETQADKTSCWIRVTQQWTGKNWGILFTPRIGQEVVVTFLNGNPDYPLITGCVYNGENLPPYLPDEPTKSTIKTNSSLGGNGFNELRFEDKANSEEIYIHAQKDMNIDILNGNRTTTLEGENGGGNDTLLLKKGDRTMTLNQGNETITLQQGNRTMTLNQGNETTTLQQGNRTLDITGNNTEKISGDYTLNVGGNFNITVGGALNINSTGAISIQGSNSYTLQAAQAAQIQALSYQLTAQTTVDIQAQAQMTLNAPTIQQTAQAMFSIQSGVVQVSSNGMVTITGQMIMLG